MKTLLLSLEYKPFKGGVSEYYSNIFDTWPDNNFYVLTSKIEKSIEEDSRIIRKQLISKYFSWLSSFYYVSEVLIKNKIKHIIVGQVLPLGTVAWILSYFLGFQYTVVLHGMDYAYAKKKKRKFFLLKKILKNAENIIVGNSYLENILKIDYPDFIKKLSVVNPGVSIQKHDYEHNVNYDFVIFFIGRLVKRKGIDRAIKAIEQININEYPDIKFFIAGGGPDEDYLKNLTTDSRIKFIGKIGNDKKWNYLYNSDIFIMPTREIDGDFEGFGIVYLEANLASVPVIATNSGGVSDAVIDGFNGILLDSDDPISIKNAIIKLYNNVELRIKLGENGRKRVIEEFDWKKQSQIFFNILNK